MALKISYKKPLLILCDLNYNQLGIISNKTNKSCYNLKHSKKVNEIDTITFDIPVGGLIKYNSSEMLIKFGFDYYSIKEISLNSDDKDILSVTAEMEATELKGILVGYAEDELIAVTPEQMYTAVIENCNMVTAIKNKYIFETDIVNTYRSLEMEDEISVYEYLVKIAEAFESCLLISTRTDGKIAIKIQAGEYDNKRVIKKGKDLNQLNVQLSTSSICTILTPFGDTDSETGQEINIMEINGGKSYITDYSYFTDVLGMTREEVLANPKCNQQCIYRNSNIVDANDLLTIARTELAKVSQPVVDATISMLNLECLEGSNATIPSLCERIIVSCKSGGYNISSKITGIDIDYENPLRTSVTISNVIKYSSTFKKLVETAETFGKVTTTENGKPILNASKIYGIINTHVAQIKNKLTDGLETQGDKLGIIYCDERVGSPTYGIIALGTSGLLFSDTKDSNGEWVFTTALNGHGLSTEVVNAIEINASQIKGDRLSSFDDSTWIDLNNGEFNFKDKIKFIDNQFSIVLANGNTIESEIESQVDNKVPEILETVNTTIAGGILDKAQITLIHQLLSDFNKEYKVIKNKYNEVYTHIYLSDVSKKDLKIIFDEYTYNYNALVSKINQIIEDNVITELEKSEYDARVLVYNEKFELLNTAINKYTEEINDSKVSNSIFISEGDITTKMEQTFIKKDDLNTIQTYNVILSNEYDTIQVDSENHPLQDGLFLCEVQLYKGMEQVYNFTINTINSNEFLNVSVNNDTKAITFSYKKTTQIYQTNGSFDIVININNGEEVLTAKKVFNWAIARQGQNGIPGTDGTSSYFHIKYAPNGTPTASQMTETPQAYIGTYVDTEEIDSLIPSKYTWTKFIGTDGNNGTNGLPGTNGTDGKTSYLHIKYSDDMVNFTANSGETPGIYLGQYVDFIEADSTVFNKYIWSKIKGEKGQDGTNGTPGTSSYFHIKYSTVSNPTIASQMTETPSEYIGTYVDNLLNDSTNPASYTWTKFIGQDGTNGLPGTNGTDGKTSYLHVKYSNDGGVTLTTNSGEDVGTYIGTYVDFIEADSNSVTAYKWARLRGNDGTSASYVSITETNQVFIMAKGQSSYTPASITLVPVFTNCNYTKWQYSIDGGVIWNNLSSGSYGITISGNQLLIPNTCSLFTDAIKSIPFKVIANDGSSDVATISRLKDGVDGVDGANGVNSTIVNLSNENHTFVATSNGNAKASSISVSISGYVGTTLTACTIGTITGIPTGMTVTKNSSGTTTPSLTIAVTTSLNTINGVITIPITCNGITINKQFTYSLAVAGTNGTDGINGTNGINGTSSYFHIKYAPNGTPIASQMTETPSDYIGTYVDNSPNDSADPTSYTWSRFRGVDGNNGTNGLPGTNGTDGTTYYLHIKYSNDGSTFTTNSGETAGAYLGQYVDTIQADSNEFSKYTWTKIKGADGVNGYSTSIECNSLVFKSGDGGTTWTPTTITLTPTFINCVYSKWQYSVNGGTYSNVTSGSNGLTINSSSKALSLNYNCSLFTTNNNTITFKCFSTISGIVDIVTISKLSVLDNEIDKITEIANSQATQTVDGFKQEVSKTYATTTSLSAYVKTTALETTVDGVNVRISKTGGFNMLLNSDAQFDNDGSWINNGGGYSVLSSNATPFFTGKYHRTSFPSGMRYFKDVVLEPNTDYIYEGYIYSSSTVAEEATAPLNFWLWTGTTPTSGLNAGSIIDYQQGLTAGKFVKCYVHFKTSNATTTVYGRFFIYSSVTVSTIGAKRLSLKKGTLQSEWTQYPNEVQTSNTNINENGVEVKHSNVGTFSRMSADGFSINDNDSGEVLAWLSSKKQWTELNVNKVFAENIINVYQGLSTLYVNHSYVGESDGSSTKPFSSFGDLQNYLLATPIINKDLTIYIYNPNFEITEQLCLHGLSGAGYLAIYYDGGVTHRARGSGAVAIRLYQIPKYVMISGGRSGYNTTDGALICDDGDGHGINVADVSCLYVGYISINCKNWGIVTERTRLYNLAVDFGKCYNAVELRDMSIYYMYDCCGGNTDFCRVKSGSFAIWGDDSNGIRPKGNVQASKGAYYSYGSGRTVTDSSRFPTASATPSVPATSNYSQSFSWTSHKTYSYSYSNWGDSDCKQGDWGYGLRGGHMFFDITSIRSFLSGTVQDGNTITLTRASSGGLSGASNVYINGSNCSSASGTPVYSNQTLLGTLTWGETKTFTLPKVIVNTLKSGGCSSLAVYVNSTEQSDYINIVNASITLKVSK